MGEYGRVVVKVVVLREVLEEWGAGKVIAAEVVAGGGVEGGVGGGGRKRSV